MLLTDIARGSKKSQSTSTQLLIIQEAHRSGADSGCYIGKSCGSGERRPQELTNALADEDCPYVTWVLG